MGCASSSDSQSDGASTSTPPSSSTLPQAHDKTAQCDVESHHTNASDRKYVASDRASASSTDSERAQIEAIRARRKTLRRPCSLASDGTLRHYNMVTGNLDDNDAYFDASNIHLVSSPVVRTRGQQPSMPHVPLQNDIDLVTSDGDDDGPDAENMYSKQAAYTDRKPSIRRPTSESFVLSSSMRRPAANESFVLGNSMRSKQVSFHGTVTEVI